MVVQKMRLHIYVSRNEEHDLGILKRYACQATSNKAESQGPFHKAEEHPDSYIF